MTACLQVVALNGVTTDSLGEYLAGLGALSAASRRWPTIRACWRDGHFALLGESLTIHNVTNYLAGEWQPTNYERWWSTAQKRDTKVKSSRNLWAERNARSLDEIRVLEAHIVPVRRNQFNPVLGTGGNVGKRDLARAANEARYLLQKPDSRAWLHGSLTGAHTAAFPDLSNGGTWFVYANKTFNSGQDWFREGKLSPWSFLLALEGALLLAGGVNKRLGTRARPYAVFPFVSEPASPQVAAEVGVSKGEFWAPLWEWPATIVEVRSLFQRGLARLGDNAARAPHEFAVAALAAGVDAGVTQFARFELRQTTSSQVYEAIPRERVLVGGADGGAGSASRASDTAAPPIASQLLMELIESRWLDRLPLEPRDAKQRGKFVGLRGFIEAAIVRVGEAPADSERWQNLLMGLTDAQLRIDRNKNLRERGVPVPLLSYRWLEKAWPDDRRPDEIELAAAIASITTEPSREELAQRSPLPAFPLLVNVFGVEVQATLARNRRTRFTVRFPSARPQRAVWHSGDPLEVLVDVAHRRLVDTAEAGATLTAGAYACPGRIIDRLLSGDPTFDVQLVAKWVPPLTLINWSQAAPPAERQRTVGVPDLAGAPDGLGLLDALFRPLFQPEPVWIGSGDNRRPLFGPAHEQRPSLAWSRRVFNLIRQGALKDAIELAHSRYLAVQCATVRIPVPAGIDTRRVAAALLVPMGVGDIQGRFSRWIQPSKNVSSRRRV